MNPVKAWIKLVSVKGIGNAKAIKIARKLGPPQNYIGKSSDLLDEIDFLTDNEKKKLDDKTFPEDWQRIEKLMGKYGIKFVSILDEKYPQPLKNIYDPPPFLFYRGTIKEKDYRRAIAVVGTRKASNYGKLSCKKIVRKLAEAGFTIISGLAYGIDTVAHFAALETGGRTLSVFATGCDQIYPPRNRKLAERISENGALLSEFIPGKKAEKWNFPTRNRIISGLSLGTLVIEGSKKSGALLTSKFALEQNRDIFALPGDINRKQAQGPNYLIKLGANIVTKAEDILDFYNLQLQSAEKPKPEMTDNEKKLYNIIFNHKPEVHFDKLLLISDFSISELSSLLLSLELKSMIKKVSGSRYMAMY